MSPLVITALMFATILGVEVPLLLRRQGRRRPFGIAKHLQKPGDSHVVVMRWWDPPGLWNPERPPGIKNMDFGGPGRAEYQMRPDGNVELQWTPHWGQPRRMVGPLPDRIREPMLNARVRRMILIVGGAYLTGIVGGFIIGWETSSRDNQADMALGGALLGFVSVGVTLAVGTWCAKGIVRRRSAPDL